MTGAIATPIPARPLLRGYFHLAAAIASPFALLWLVLNAGSPAGYVGAAVFGTGLILLFGTSALYHVPPWSERVRTAIRQVDHAVIFLAIAATYTPFCLQTLGLAWGIPVLSVVWTLAALGAVMRIAWPGAPRGLAVACYVAVGWMALVAAAPLAASLPPMLLALVVFAGVLYTAGGVVFALRRPDPWPRYFGYHEVFHLVVLAGFGVMFGVVGLGVIPG